MAVAMWNCCCLGAHFVYTIQLSTSFTVSRHAKPHTRVQECLDVTCHLHFWQNDRNLLVLFATAVTWGWNGCQKKCQHRKLTMGKKIIFLLGLQPVIFSNESNALTNELSLLPGTLFAKSSCLDHCNSLLHGCPRYLLTNYKKSQTTLLTFSWEFPKLPYLSSFFSPLAAHWFMDTVQTCFPVLQLPQLDRSRLLDWTPERFQNQSTSYALLRYFHSLFSLCVRALT